eukprot:TRINITY_DN8809_c0_g1_i5.p1 TRINITY_DN8809_c0_g1~~TRINITY_DN8809_c0_g1_i5.p1  ORF type:complete len:119 (+),score=18.75 TRINITY_DN8809_c0_g1_i5:128-484(+)
MKLVHTPLTQIKPLVSKLRVTFDTGLTRPLEWRKEQLHQIKAMLLENREIILQALNHDLRFPPYTPNKLMWLQRLQKVAQFFSKFSSPFKGGLWSWGWWALFVAVVLVSYFYFPRGFH